MRDTAGAAGSGRSRAMFQAETAILTAVDVGLESLGEQAKDAMFFVLESRFGVDRFQVFARAAMFVEGLRTILGISSGDLFRKISLQLRRTRSNDAEVQAIVESFAKDLEDAAYGVEHGLG